jgi:hypothetical protein
VSGYLFPFSARKRETGSQTPIFPKPLLGFFEEEVVGGVRHKRLIADV